MSAQRILVLYNEPVLPCGHPNAEAEHEVIVVSEVVAGHLVEAGFEVSRVGIPGDAESLLAELEARQPDAVFNLFEGPPDNALAETCIAGLLEWQGIPFTGSPSQALSIARNKPLAKCLLRGAGLPTPEFQVVERLPLDSRPRRWPVIVKPGLRDASEGIDQGSVVRCWDRLVERVEALLGTYGPPVLVERFITGQEFNVSVMETGAGLRVLPLCEIRFDCRDSALWPIVTYDAKWRPESEEFKATPPYFPEALDPRLAAQLADLAARAFRLIGCRDYARVDFRVSPASKPYIIEVNPNACISSDAGFTRAVEASGQTHAQFLAEVTRAALARDGRRFDPAAHDCYPLGHGQQPYS